MSSNVRDILQQVMTTPERAASRAGSREQGGFIRDSIDNANVINDNNEEGLGRMNIRNETNMGTVGLDDIGVRVYSSNVDGTAGTSKPASFRDHSILFVNPTEVEYLQDPLPSSNRNSSLSGSSRELLSARTSSSLTPSVTWVDTNVGSSKFGVFVIPADSKEFDSMCMKEIGNGTRMCIKKGCKTNHRGGHVASVLCGEIFVQRSSDSVFLAPKTHSRNIASEVLDYWLTARRKIEDWSTDFAVANLTEYHEVLSTEDLRQANAYAGQAKKHRSPGLLKFSRYEKFTNTFASLISRLSSSRRQRGLDFQSKKRSNSTEDLDDENITSSIRKLSDELSADSDSEKSANLKDSIEHIYKLLDLVAERLDNKDLAINEEVKILFSRVEMFHTDLGSRSITRTDSWQIPTIWGSIAAFAGAIDDVQKCVDSLPSTNEMKKHLTVEFDRIEAIARETVELITLELEERVTTVLAQKESALKENAKEIKRLSQTVANDQKENEEVLLLLARGQATLKNEISDLRSELRSTGFSGGSTKATRSCSTSSSGDCSNYVPLVTYVSKVAELDDDIVIINGKISKLIAEADSLAIRAFGLGFRDRESSDGWVMQNLTAAPFGLIVDAHLLFEHLNHMVTDNEGSLAILTSIKKLGLTNMTQGLCLTSYEARLPKMLTKSSNMAISAKSKSVTHFDKIPNYAWWDGNYAGTRALIKDNIRRFQVAHIDLIHCSTFEDSRGRRIALEALQESVSWIQEFIAFIDETYKDCVQQSTFSPERAWELTTQLGRRVFIEIAGPREGVNTAVDVGDNLRTSKLIFWPTLRCHDIMKEFKDANFKDHPTISAEYVKFLTSNSGSDLDSRMSSMAEELVATTKALKTAEKNVQNALNAVDEMKRKMTVMDKNLKDLETKVKRG